MCKADVVTESDILTDGTVALRPLHRDHAEGLFACLSTDPEIARWTRVPWPYTRAHLRAYLDDAQRSVASGRDLLYVVGTPERDDVLGCVGLHRIGATPQPRSSFRPNEVGYWLAESARGKGLMTRAVRVVSRHGLLSLGLPVLLLQTKVGNVASQAVALRCGYRPIGTVMASEVDDDGNDHDRFELRPADLELADAAERGDALINRSVS